jgi:hypothetical protein
MAKIMMCPDDKENVMMGSDGDLKSRYGWIEIDHVRYDHDIIIHTNRSVSKRSKKKSKKLKNHYGHTPLAEHELSFISDEQPSVIYIGTGQYGDLPITIESHGILRHFETFIRPTPEILTLMEEESRSFAAVIHVSC